MSCQNTGLLVAALAAVGLGMSPSILPEPAPVHPGKPHPPYPQKSTNRREPGSGWTPKKDRNRRGKRPQAHLYR